MIPWAVAQQSPLSMGFPRQEYRSGLLFPSPGDLPDLGIEPGSPSLQADSLPPEPPEKPLKMEFPGGPVDSALSLPRAQVHMLVRELRSHSCVVWPKKKKKSNHIMLLHGSKSSNTFPLCSK